MPIPGICLHAPTAVQDPQALLTLLVTEPLWGGSLLCPMGYSQGSCPQGLGGPSCHSLPFPCRHCPSSNVGAHAHRRTHTHTRMHIDTHRHAHTCAHTHTPTLPCTYIYTHSHVHMHSRIHTHMLSRAHTHSEPYDYKTYLLFLVSQSAVRRAPEHPFCHLNGRPQGWSSAKEGVPVSSPVHGPGSR